MFQWFVMVMAKYGYIVLVSSLFLEMIALPFPGEALMSYAGFLAYQGQFSWPISIITASLGTILGITFSYWIGFKLGNSFFEKYGKYMHMGPERLNKASLWFKKYGNKLLLITYFIPGIRHITGYFSGVTQIPYRVFATYAYLGSIIWVSTFISLGKILGPQWEQFHSTIKKYLIIAGLIVLLVLVLIYIYRVYKFRLKEQLEAKLNKAIETFHTLGRVKVLVIVSSLIFMGLSILMVGLIQDYIHNEFLLFNEVTSLLVQLIFKQNWDTLMNLFRGLASLKLLLPITLLTLLWVKRKSRDHYLESLFLIVVVIGGEILEEILRLFLHHFSPIASEIVGSFPSEKSLMSIVIYGFTVFLFLRHTNKAWLHNLSIFLVLLILLSIGLSGVYLQIEKPSDIVGGYVFGGVWLSLNVILLEIYRILRRLKLLN